MDSTNDIDVHQIFSEPLHFKSLINGNVNGGEFVIEGYGVGDASQGSINGKWVCTSGQVSYNSKIGLNFS